MLSESASALAIAVFLMVRVTVHTASAGRALAGTAPVDDLKSFWGALGCSCFAF